MKDRLDLCQSCKAYEYNEPGDHNRIIIRNHCYLIYKNDNNFKLKYTVI